MPKLITTSNPEGFTVTVQGAPIVACPLSSSAYSRLRAKHAKIKRGVEKIDGVALTKELFDLTAKSWGAEIQDETGTPLECTSANKRLICEHNMAFVNEFLEEVESVEEARRNGELGNSQPGPSGTSPWAK